MANTALTMAQVSDALNLSAQAILTLVRRGELTCSRNELGWRVFDAAEVEAYKTRTKTQKPRLSVTEAARVLGVVPQTIRSLADTGKLPCQRDAKGWRTFDPADIEAKNAKPEAPTTGLTTTQVARELGVTQQTVRYYTDRGWLTVSCDALGQYSYNPDDVEAIRRANAEKRAGLSFYEVAQELGVTVPTVRNLVACGKLRSTSNALGRRYFKRNDVDEYKARRDAPAAGISLAQVAGALGISPQTVRNLADAGEIPSRRDSKGWRVFDAAEVEAYRVAHPEHRERSQARSARQQARIDLLAAVDAAGPRGLEWNTVKHLPGWELAFEKLFQEGLFDKKYGRAGAIITRKSGA